MRIRRGSRSSPTLFPIFSLVVPFLLAGWGGGWQQDDPIANPARWESALAKFEEEDRAMMSLALSESHTNHPPATATSHRPIVFVGSSSIRLWNLRTWFPHHRPLNRGFGGSHLSDVAHYVDRLVLKHRPDVVVVYAGENDIAAGRSPEGVAASYRAFTSKLRAELPACRVVFIGLKPSLKRWDQIESMRRTNNLIREVIAADPLQSFLDVEPAMLDEKGRPRPALFRNDGLHLSEEGYRVWTEMVTPKLGPPPFKTTEH